MKKKIFIAGHNGMVGSAINRLLSGDEYRGKVELFTASRKELDLLDQSKTFNYIMDNQFDEIYMAAAKVGGIRANSSFPADFIYENLLVQNNIIHSSWKAGVSKLLFLGSSCIYPKFSKQPIVETELLSSDLEPTNSAYAVAKIAGLQLCKNYNQQYGTDFRAIMPTNLYGKNDNFHRDDAHVLPALLRRIHEAKAGSVDEVIIWGSGKPKREFMSVDDMAKGSVHVMNMDKDLYCQSVLPEYQYFNIGTGTDISIKDLAHLIADIVGYEGALKFDVSQPDGTPRKLLNVDRIRDTGWKAEVSLKEGIIDTYEWYLENQALLRREH